MNIINAIQILCELDKGLFTIYSNNLLTKDILKNIRIKHNITFLNNVPIFKYEYIEVNNQRINSGTIIKRPLDKIKPLNKFEYHYGVVLGTSINDEKIILNMTNENNNNVSIINFEKFIKDSKYKFEINQIGKTVKGIIERAKNYQYDIYSLSDLNCKDFAYFCSYLIKPPQRSKIYIDIHKILNDFLEKNKNPHDGRSLQLRQT